jgi:hypothetical protein
MIRTHRLMLPAVLVFAAASATTLLATRDLGPTAIHVREVTPPEAKVGDIVTAHGDCLNPARVLAVYLTTGTEDYKVEILDQTDHWIQFRVPAGVPVGKYRVAVIPTDAPTMLEQPAFLKVVEARRTPTG